MQLRCMAHSRFALTIEPHSLHPSTVRFAIHRCASYDLLAHRSQIALTFEALGSSAQVGDHVPRRTHTARHGRLGVGADQMIAGVVEGAAE